MLFVVGRDNQVFTVDEVKAVSRAANGVAVLRVYDAGRDREVLAA